MNVVPRSDAVELDRASVLGDDAVGAREPEPGAVPDAFRREEGLEHVWFDVVGDAGAGVLDDELHVTGPG